MALHHKPSYQPFLPILIAGILLASCSAFVSNDVTIQSLSSRCTKVANQPMLPGPPRSSTELQMGLRNFIKRKVLRKKGKPDGSNSNGEIDENDNPRRASSAGTTPFAANRNGKNSPPEITTKDTNKIIQNAAATAAAKKGQQQQPVRMGEDPTTGKINVESRLGPETVQERISRIKRGEMSQAEKEAFLKSALSTGNTPESRLPMRTGEGERNNNSEDSKASPFPKDSILRNMARGNKPSKESEPLPPPVAMDSNSKKQKYLDMVTDPRRFNNLSSGGGLMKSSNDDDNESATGSSTDNEQETSATASSSNIEEPNLPQDLGARLGAAAMVNEQRNVEIRKRLQEKERQQEQLRRERERRLADIQQQRQEELAKREVDILKRRRAKEAEQAQRQQRNDQAEEARRAELMKAQDDYWTKKLAETKAAEAEAAEKARSEKEQEEEADVKPVEAAEGSEEDKNIEVSSEETKGPALAVENAINQPTQAIEEMIGRAPLNDIPRPSDYQNDQMRKKAELQNEQMARLRSLNSPLPNKAKGPRPPRPIRKSAFEPQVPVSANRSPAQALGDLTTTIQKTAASASKPLPTAEQEIVEPTTNKSSSSKPAAKLEESSSKGSSFNPFSRFGGANKEPVQKPPRAQQSSPAQPPPSPVRGAAARQPAASSPPPAAPKRKGPIRMELPLGDEDDEEPAMTEGMTIGEIMKRQKAAGGGEDQEKRSKQWGVDMSRFQD